MTQAWSPEAYIEAYRFAAHAHHGQTVPGTALPYLMHLSFVCMEMMSALREEAGHDETLAIRCALLHDVIEDTPITREQVQMQFGLAVADGVQALSKNPALPKDMQLADSLQRIRQQPIEIWMVKLCDRITNLGPPPAHWKPQKIAQYRIEAQAILAALRDASPFLAARLEHKIAAYPS